ncbi:kinesin-like protein KIF23 isoform X2 [Anabrus simplex]|uniref:kinesin-like protein KIF23 isoform X2 n=1 Tax=Anabrus simplex TaxID=316456 RepID=UPI0035A32623
MRPTRCRTPYKKTPAKTRPAQKDSVKVYCRIRPLLNDNDVSCLNVLSKRTVQLISPESAINYRNGVYKEMQYTFQQVFSDQDSQKTVFDFVALPLVENLVQGKNSLLFTYGVTGSGKTYTMTGEPTDGGIMPRCLDVIFNSISGYQAKKFIFKPDKMNGFDVQSETDAMADRQNELCANMHAVARTNAKTPKKKDSNSDIMRTPDTTIVKGIDEDNTYAVFVTYIEIYNNNTYDLLEESQDDGFRGRTLQNRIIREDANHNMYVHGVTEVEVKTTEEAFEAFYRGQKKKKMANTVLNAESSRSHSVFTIRLVQAPLDGQGETALQNKNAICVSQLSLVDLAGSERTNRTKSSGQRLREAGTINNSLMTLRSCIEILRENQLTGSNKMVPYRDSRITHLFKNYFDGEGLVHVIVCVNPRSDDYDETVHVMKFAEMTQEVQLTRPYPEKLQLDLIPGRRKANQIFKQAIQKVEENSRGDCPPINVDLGLVYSLGPPFPSMEMTSAENEEILQNLIVYLEHRLNKRQELLSDLPRKQEKFRNQLIEVEKENILTKQETSSLKATLEQERKKNSTFETRIVELEGIINNLQRHVADKESTIELLQRELREIKMQLNQHILEKEKVKLKYSTKVAAETEKLKDAEQKLKIQKTQFREKEERLRKVKQLLVEDPICTPRPLSTRSNSTLCNTPVPSDENIPSVPMEFITPSTSKRADVVQTTGGGAQVIFNEMETLRQQSPTSSPPRKRTAKTNSTDSDIKASCAISIEGHGKKPRL